MNQDDFPAARELLTDDCVYYLGEEVLNGPENICSSYEQNMIKGRKKLDELKWGTSQIEDLGESKYLIHFVDYIKHQGIAYTHKPQQEVTVNSAGKILCIKHMEDPEEQDRLEQYYKKVGLK